jgi:probable rRNA maturation factor
LPDRQVAEHRRPKGTEPLVEVVWGIRTQWARAISTIHQAAQAAIVAEGFTNGELSIAVVGQRRMARLHEQFSGIPGPTDVLTFDLGTNLEIHTIEGEIVICSDVARLRARTIPKAVRELALYCVHGILHLAGYDDHDPDEFERMHAREDELLASLGLGRVFSDGPQETQR